MAEFLLADLGEGLEDATLVRWLVDVGDTVALNDVLCVVETAKAEVEVPSPFAGVVTELGGDEGDTILVGELLASIDDGTGDGRPEPTLVGYGHDRATDRSRRAHRARPAASAVGLRRAAEAGRVLAKPPVRRLALQLGVDLAELAPGTGPGGIITRTDVERAASLDGRRSKVEQVRGVRARIANRMTEARALIPDASCSVVADCTRLLEARRPGVTPFAMIAHHVVGALRATPVLNASYDEKGPSIHVHRDIHLGIAAATDRGLLVPVVRDAGARDLDDLADELERLSAEARAGTIDPHDLQGSTFTISNFGALGLDQGIPIINYPEAAILGVGSIRPRPHVVDGEVVARPTTTLTLVFDHRVCDGVDPARFLTDLRARIEAPPGA